MLDVCCFPSCGKIYQQTLQISQIVEILNLLLIFKHIYFLGGGGVKFQKVYLINFLAKSEYFKHFSGS